VYRVFLLLAILQVVYVLPLVVVLGAAIRLMFGLNSNRMRMAAALLLALPQSAMVQFGPSVMFGPPGTGTGATAIVFYATLALTAAGCVFWWLARRGIPAGRYWIEALLVVAVSAFQLFSVDNWIAH